MSDLLGAYRPGTSVLHRLPAGTKLLAVAVASLLAVAFRSPTTTVVLVVVVAVLVVVARVRLRVLARSLRALLIVMTLLAAFQTWQRGPAHALVVVGTLVALILLATVLTTTTSVDELIDTLTRALRPLRRLGVDPELVALAFSLMIRAIPSTLEVARETRQAARARGLERDPRALLVPMVLRSVAQARATGDALVARGIVDD